MPLKFKKKDKKKKIQNIKIERKQIVKENLRIKIGIKNSNSI
jgi:hypothetical protein